LRKIVDAFWFIIALLYLAEVWAWSRLSALIGLMVKAIPLERLKSWVVEKLEPMSPLATLAVFIIPVLMLEPFKIVALWFFAKGHMFAGIMMFVIAKFVGLGVVAFLFQTCKPKLLQIKAVAWLYETGLAAERWARMRVEPALNRLRALREEARQSWQALLRRYGISGRGAFRAKLARHAAALRRRMRWS
jgi:hypothetical protein